jgi:hypothetical protein
LLKQHFDLAGTQAAFEDVWQLGASCHADGLVAIPLAGSDAVRPGSGLI